MIKWFPTRRRLVEVRVHLEDRSKKTYRLETRDERIVLSPGETFVRGISTHQIWKDGLLIREFSFCAGYDETYDYVYGYKVIAKASPLKAFRRACRSLVRAGGRMMGNPIEEGVVRCRGCNSVFPADEQVQTDDRRHCPECMGGDLEVSREWEHLATLQDGDGSVEFIGLGCTTFRVVRSWTDHAVNVLGTGRTR